MGRHCNLFNSFDCIILQGGAEVNYQESQERESVMRKVHERILVARRTRRNLMLRSTAEDIEQHNEEAHTLLAMLADVTPDDASKEDPRQVERLDELKNWTWGLIVSEERLGVRNGWLA